MAYYTEIDGVKMDKILLDYAESYGTENNDDYSRVVPDLMNQLMDGRGITQIELSTVQYISRTIMPTVTEVDTFVRMLKSISGVK